MCEYLVTTVGSLTSWSLTGHWYAYPPRRRHPTMYLHHHRQCGGRRGSRSWMARQDKPPDRAWCMAPWGWRPPIGVAGVATRCGATVRRAGRESVHIPRGQHFIRNYRPAEIQAMASSMYPAWVVTASVLFVYEPTMVVLFSSSAPTKNHGLSNQIANTGYISPCCITCCTYP